MSAASRRAHCATMSCAHEGKGGIISRLYPDGESGVSRFAKRRKLIVRFRGDICHACEASDGLARWEVFANEVGYLYQALCFQSKRVCARQEDATVFGRWQAEKARLDLR